jgi:hypothetical protein
MAAGIAAAMLVSTDVATGADLTVTSPLMTISVGLCTLNQVDP